MCHLWPTGRLVCGVFVILLFASATPARAQGAVGTITGSATDESGAVLPGVAITIRNTETGVVRELVTDADGRFLAPNLPPGVYAVTAALGGFGTVERTGIRLTVGRDAVADFRLKVGGIKDTINVVG